MLLIALIIPLVAQADKPSLTIPIRVPVQEGTHVPGAVLAECERERKLA